MKSLRLVAVMVLFSLSGLGSGAQAQQMPDLSALFSGGQPANPFMAPQANSLTNLLAPLGLMGGAGNPMIPMMNPGNWLNPSAYAQFVNPMSYLQMMNPMSYLPMMNPMSYLPMMNPNSYMQMLNPALGLAGVNPVGDVPAIDPNTYVQFVIRLLGGLHAQPEASEGFLEQLQKLGE